MLNLCCCVKVRHSTVAIVEKFGRHHKNLVAGCHCVPWLCGNQVAGELSLKIQKLSDLKCRVKTMDNEFVDVTASVRYQLDEDHATEAFYGDSNVREWIQNCTIQAIGHYAEGRNLDQLSVGTFSVGVLEKVRELLPNSGSGYNILETLIMDIKLDKRHENALLDVSAGRRKHLDEVERRRVDTEASAYRQEVDATSTAHRLTFVADCWKDTGFRENVHGVSGKEFLDMMKTTQYIDAWREMGAKSSSSVSLRPPQGLGSVRELRAQIDLGPQQSREDPGPSGK